MEVFIDNELTKKAFSARKHILTMAQNGGCYIGSALSCVDIILYLYSKFMNISPDKFADPDRDYFFLSKGHAVPALYGTFIELGWMEETRLNNHLKSNDYIYWHPNRNIPGVELNTGSLGHALSVAVGVAMDCKLKNTDNKVIVMCGDGELNEGSVWEACLVASAYDLDNLILIIDRNKFQANTITEKLIPLEPLADKFKSFGMEVKRIDGHNFDEIENCFYQIPFKSGRPSVIISETIRGKGVPSIENRADKWYAAITPIEKIEMINEMQLQNNNEHRL